MRREDFSVGFCRMCWIKRGISLGDTPNNKSHFYRTTYLVKSMHESQKMCFYFGDQSSKYDFSLKVCNDFV